MKKNISLAIVLVFILSCITGCTKNNQFDSSAVIKAFDKYGMTEIQNFEDLENDLDIHYFSEKPETGGGYYYFTKNHNEAQYIFDKGINENSVLIKDDVNVDEIVFGIIVEGELSEKSSKLFGQDVDDYYINYPSTFMLIVMNDKNAAQKLFEYYEKKQPTNNVTVKTGERNGYKYRIFLDTDGTNKRIEKFGTFVKDNKILIVQAYGLDDGKTGFANYIFKELGLIDPS